MAIPEGYRLLTANDVGKTFGVELERVIYCDTSVTPISATSYKGIDLTNFVNQTNMFSEVECCYIADNGILDAYKTSMYAFGTWERESIEMYKISVTSYHTDVEWNNWLYVKETATPKETFISDMNSLGKSITDKAGASGKKSITELKDLVDNLKTTFTGQEKTVTPSKTSQVITPDSGYDGLSKVTVNVIPDEYIVPSGSLNIIANGIYDVTSKASVVVRIPGDSTSEEWDGSYTESDLGYTITLEGNFGDDTYGYLSYQVNGGEIISCEDKTSPVVIEGVDTIVFTKSGVSSRIDIGTTSGGSDIGSVNASQSVTYTPTQDVTLYCKTVMGGSSD